MKNELPEQYSFGTSSNRPTGMTRVGQESGSRIWLANVPPKVKKKASLNALAIEVIKLKRNMRVTGFCNICGMWKEDGAHALYHCPHAFSLWRNMRHV
jgi:hypothetical protein